MTWTRQQPCITLRDKRLTRNEMRAEISEREGSWFLLTLGRKEPGGCGTPHPEQVPANKQMLNNRGII